MRVLVTGGAGFVGSHLCEALLARDDHVVVLDNLATGRVANTELFRDHPGYELVLGSVLHADLVEELVGSADVTVHLASAVGVEVILDRPIESIGTIVRGTESVLESGRRNRRKIVLASTSEVYGKNPGPLHEDADRILGPTSRARWAYGTAKALDEMLAFAYWREHRVPTVVMRLFNVVGPRQTGAYGMVLPRLVSQALLGEDLVVYGDGRQTRCFCHVADAVRAVLGLIDDDRAVGNPYNVGSTEEVSIIDLARLVAEVTGAEGRIVCKPYAEVFSDQYEDIPRRVPDTSRIHHLLGWEPRLPLRSIVTDVMEHARKVGPENLLG